MTNHLYSIPSICQIKVRIPQLGQRAPRRLQTKHERLWAEEVVEFQYRLLVINEVSAFQPTDQNTVLSFHCIKVHRLLTEKALYGLCARYSGELSAEQHTFRFLFPVTTIHCSSNLSCGTRIIVNVIRIT